jgi:hypothetical protein
LLEGLLAMALLLGLQTLVAWLPSRSQRVNQPIESRSSACATLGTSMLKRCSKNESRNRT